MLRKIFLVSVFIATVMNGLGQYISEPTEMPDRLNAVGVNLTPFMVVAMNGIPVVARFSLIYKRQLDTNKKIRFTGNYEIRENYEEDLTQARTVAFTDTSISYRMDNENHFILDTRVGMEWFKPDPKGTMIYGLDLIVGIDVDEMGFRIKPYWDSGMGLEPSPFEPELIYDQSVTHLIAGFDFSIGYKLVASEKVDCIIRWTPQVVYRIPLNETYSDITYRIAPADSDILMSLRGIEFYIDYKF